MATARQNAAREEVWRIKARAMAKRTATQGLGGGGQSKAGAGYGEGVAGMHVHVRSSGAGVERGVRTRKAMRPWRRAAQDVFQSWESGGTE